MKNFIASIVIVFTFSSCINECANYNIDNENLLLFQDLIDTLKEPDVNKKQYYLEELEERISSNDFKTLSKINFNNIEIIQNQVYVITLGFEKFSNLNNKFKRGDICSYYLFYSSNSKLKKEISYYEGYANCRVSYEEISPNWTLVIQNQKCED